jgi:hypothetical protein
MSFGEMTTNPLSLPLASRGRASRRMGLLALLVTGAGVGALQAANLSFLSNSPVSYFQQADVDLMRKNALEVLDSSDPAAQRSWSNSKTGASGSAQAQGQFATSDGTPCKRLRVMNKFRNLESDAIYTVCKVPSRGWVINTDARPAGG